MSRVVTERMENADSYDLADLAEADRREHRRVGQGALHPGAGEGVVHNVSLGGACLTPGSPMEIGERLTLALQDLSAATRQELRAEVVWARKGRIGLRWVELTPEQFLWLCQTLGFWWGHGSRFAATVAGEVARPELLRL